MVNSFSGTLGKHASRHEERPEHIVEERVKHLETLAKQLHDCCASHHNLALILGFEEHSSISEELAQSGCLLE
jgi:hypothetical protein